MTTLDREMLARLLWETSEEHLEPHPDYRVTWPNHYARDKWYAQADLIIERMVGRVTVAMSHPDATEGADRD